MSARLLVQSPPASERFRERLQHELARRCARNARYSLRGFANALGTDHATLSQVLRGKRAATAATIQRLGVRIGLTQEQIDGYKAAERAAAQPARPVMPAQSADLDWHAFAILELMRLPDFKPDVGWMARVLGSNAQEVQVAIQHLVRLGFVPMTSRTKWDDLTGGALVRQDQFTVASLLRMLEHASDLQRASARSGAASPRLHGAVTLAITPAQLANLLALAESFLHEAAAGQRTQASLASELYQLEIHCYPVSTEPPKG
jgi:transcriptional regulator with XRE-family HTH domain